MYKSARMRSSRRFYRCTSLWRCIVGALSLAGSAVAIPGPAYADRIHNSIAVFNGLDKITGRIVSFEVAINETIQFGALQLTPRACYTRPITETPNTTAFIEVDELSEENQAERLFTGWIFAASPGLHGIEHPIYDIWLVECNRAISPPAGMNTDTVPTSEDSKVPVVTPETHTKPANATDAPSNNSHTIKAGDIDPSAPPLPIPRPLFEQQEEMQMDVEELYTPLQNGPSEDTLFPPLNEEF